MADWPAYSVERWAIARLRPYAGNAKRHSVEQISELRLSLRQFGWTMPILARADGTVIAGHGRLEAAQSEGFDHVPVVVANGWTDAQCRAYGLADNKLSELGVWDEDALIAEVLAVKDEIVIPGFDDTEMARVLEESEPPDTSPQLDGLTFSVIVRCRDEDHQRDLLARFAAEGLTCDALIS